MASVPVKAFGFKGKCLDDAGMAKLAALNPEVLMLEHLIVTDAGAAQFAEMKALKVLRMSHTDRLTPKSAAALADHPALETFSNDGKFGVGGQLFSSLAHQSDVWLRRQNAFRALAFLD